MNTSPIPCPDCAAPVKRFRSVPGRIRRLFKFRLYACPNCNSIIETSEVVTRTAAAELSKRYVARVEPRKREP